MNKTFISENRFPTHLKQAFVVPIFKKGDTEDPSNYRPISITPALAKVFEKILQQQMIEYMDKNRMFSSLQFGFRKHFSTTDALLFATEKIRQKIDANENVTAAFINLSRAFDSTSHVILLKKLSELNFTDEAISMIKSYLNERIQKVTLSTCESDWIQLYQGVPQGTILGPLLFNVYVNNMIERIDNSCNLVQYADDTMIFTSNKNVYDSLKALEKNIRALERYFESHLLTINASKTEFIVFSKPHKNRVMENLKL